MKTRQVIMLRDLLHNSQVRLREFMKKLDISLRTVRMEIHDINAMVKPQNIAIRSSSAKGYFIISEERERFAMFLTTLIASLKKYPYQKPPANVLFLPLPM